MVVIENQHTRIQEQHKVKLSCTNNVIYNILCIYATIYHAPMVLDSLHTDLLFHHK